MCLRTYRIVHVIGLVLASFFLIAMLLLSIQEQRKQHEPLLALIPGTLVVFYFAIVEMLEAGAALAGSRAQAIDVATSIVFLASAALLVRLVFRRLRTERATDPKV